MRTSQIFYLVILACNIFVFFSLIAYISSHNTSQKQEKAESLQRPPLIQLQAKIPDPPRKLISLVKRFAPKPHKAAPATTATKQKAGGYMKKFTSASRKENPLYLLGAYDSIETASGSKRPPYRIIAESNYCDRADLYHLNNPKSIFNQSHIFTDFAKNTFPVVRVFKKIAKVSDNRAPKGEKNRFRKYALDENITHTFMQVGHFHTFFKAGNEFLCSTQTHNHIPGISAIVGKDTTLNTINRYIEHYKENPQCFNKDTLYPLSYRLQNKNECMNFFKILNSKEYEDKLQSQPYQYLIKVARGAHQSSGVFLLDDGVTNYLNNEYDGGAKCEKIRHPLIAQTYIANPLLLNFNNKFDFRIYMLVASTNPLITYYHDGFLRVSINSFDSFSSDRATHLTNTHLSEIKLKEAKNKGETVNGMTAKQLKEYIWWSFDRFQTYLLETGKITDPNWLDNYLRPAFKKALVHLVRMAKDSLYKKSNVYALHGVDFMLDDNMKLWFIESNPSPLLGSTSAKKNKIYIEFLDDMFKIVHAYYRSRMKRVVSVVKRMQAEMKKKGSVDIGKWKAEYESAVKNRLEPEYKLDKKNSYHLIVDENLLGAAAYFGYLDAECAY